MYRPRQKLGGYRGERVSVEESGIVSSETEAEEVSGMYRPKQGRYQEPEYGDRVSVEGSRAALLETNLGGLQTTEGR